VSIVHGLDMTKRYTYEEYYTWGEDFPRCELIDGIVHWRETPPSSHQAMLGNILGYFYKVYDRKKYMMYIAPLDVRFNHDTGDDIVLQPEFLVLENSKQPDPRCIIGAPDLVVEVIDKSTVHLDMIVKFNKYRDAGVREYWLVNPFMQTVSVHVLIDGEYSVRNYCDDMPIASTVLPELEITSNDINDISFEVSSYEISD